MVWARLSASWRAWWQSPGSVSCSPSGPPGSGARTALSDKSWKSPGGGKRRPRNTFSLAAAFAVSLFSIGCATGTGDAIRLARPPLPNDQALNEWVLVCQPRDGDCQPTRIVVEVCENELDKDCKVRRGLQELFSYLEAYDKYVAKLRGEEVPK